MSRSGYSEDCDGWALIRWRGAVASAIRGKRGQELLRDLVKALDSLPEKKLALDSLVTPSGEYCALGAVGRMRGIDIGSIDTYEREDVARAFGISGALAAEIMFQNDEYGRTNEDRWIRMRRWATEHIIEPAEAGNP